MNKTELCDEIARIIMVDKETIKYGIEANDKALISLTIENLLENMDIMEISDIIAKIAQLITKSLEPK